jgi:hypothetical protein
MYMHTHCHEYRRRKKKKEQEGQISERFVHVKIELFFYR